MKLFIRLVLLFVGLQISSQAQNTDSLSINELGISFSGLHQYGLLFRHGHKNALWRSNLLYIDGTNLKNDLPQTAFSEYSKQSTKTEWSFGSRLLIGREFRKYINQFMAIKYGIDVSSYYGQLKITQLSTQLYTEDNSDITYQQKFSSSTVQCAINPTFGVLLEASKWNFSIEILPGISYSVTKINDIDNRELHYYNQTQTKTLNTDNRYTVKRLQYGLLSSSAIFSIAYRL